MKSGRNLNVAERTHIKSSKLNPSDWKIAKKETETWTLVHRYLRKSKQVLAPNR